MSSIASLRALSALSVHINAFIFWAMGITCVPHPILIAICSCVTPCWVPLTTLHKYLIKWESLHINKLVLSALLEAAPLDMISRPRTPPQLIVWQAWCLYFPHTEQQT